jgi:8-oxo-dGTP pyrophosphatase MutT (NUDIX family)
MKKPSEPLVGTFAAIDDSDWLKWETRSREEVAQCSIFSVNKIVAENKSDHDKRGRFFSLSCGPWVNVIALTHDRKLVMVEQYRHGIEDLTLEVPGGSIDDTDIDALAAAARELREETGCIAERWSFLGKNHPNPALQNNLCYTYLAEGVHCCEEPKFDGSGTERIRVRHVGLDKINSLISDGTVSHALVIVAFHFLGLKRPDLISSALNTPSKSLLENID